MKTYFSKTLGLLCAAAWLMSGCSVIFPAPTPTPTATPTATATFTPLPTATITLTATPTNTSTPSNTPTITPTATATIPPYRAKVINMSNLGLRIEPNHNFSIDVGFLNTGSEPWTTKFCAVAVDNGMVDLSYSLKPMCIGDIQKTPVMPGQQIHFTFGAFGSEYLGPHYWNYVLMTPDNKLVPGGIAHYYYTSF